MTSTKLTLKTCSLKDGDITPDGRATFSLQINPAKFSHNRSIEYSEEAVALGQIGQELKFKRIPPDTVTFETVLDGTGVVPTPTGSPTGVAPQLEALLKVLYTYEGDKHEPNHVQLLWGTFVFVGRLTTLNTNYTLFKPGGQPLRATATLTFKGALAKPKERVTAGRNSPDLSHVVEVREGDTLPLLCKRIYGDSRYYADVARFNGLAGFRTLRPGLKLHFPPLD